VRIRKARATRDEQNNAIVLRISNSIVSTKCCLPNPNLQSSIQPARKLAALKSAMNFPAENRPGRDDPAYFKNGLWKDTGVLRTRR
jgi:hypothetical protein